MGSPRNAALQEVRPDGSTEWLNPTHPCRGVNTIASARDGRVELLTPDGKTARRKFALVGFSTSTRHMAPLNEPEWAVVGMNQLQRHLRNAVTKDGEVVRDDDGEVVTELRHEDLHFEIHKNWNTALVPGTDHAAWLRDCEIPCYMTDLDDELPYAMRFPIERLIEKFEIDYFTSTVAYMVAWAIDHIDGLVEGRLKSKQGGNPSVEYIRKLYAEYTIGIFGIDLVVGGEYEDERPCAEFWLGQAMARNITLLIPRESALLKQNFRYGYEMEAEGYIRSSDLARRQAETKDEYHELNDKCVELWGRIQEIERAVGETDEAKASIAKRHEELTELHQQASTDAILARGRLMEVDWWTEFRTLRERGASMEG